MTKGFPWTDAEEKRLRDAYLSPETTAKGIARDFGLTRDQVVNRIRKLGISKPRKPATHVQLDTVGSATSFLLHGYDSRIVWIDSSRVTWFNERRWRCVRSSSNAGAVYVSDNITDIPLHRSLLAARRSEMVDHRDRDPLNNRISNLRIATSQQNAFNTRPPLGKSGFKGVWLHECGLFGAMITVDGRKTRIGYYKTAREAARVHDAAAKILRGDFAYLNLPDDLMSDDEIAANKTLIRVVYHRVSTRAA